MTTPTTPERISRPAFRLDSDEAWAVVAGSHTGILTTLRRDGSPITLPVWFIAHEGSIYVRSPRTAKKINRVQHDGRASFLVESGESWQNLRAVHYTGIATVLAEADPATNIALELLRAKYAAFEPATHRLPREMQMHYDAADQVVVRLVPDGRVLGWDNSRIPLSD